MVLLVGDYSILHSQFIGKGGVCACDISQLKYNLSKSGNVSLLEKPTAKHTWREKWVPLSYLLMKCEETTNLKYHIWVKR